MNSRGPLPQPDSQRGIRENGGALPEFVQEELIAPSWLTKAEKEYFAEVVENQRAAGVGMRKVDAENYGRYVRMCFMQRKEKDPRQALAIGRGIDQLCGVLCIGEYPRQRVGIRGKKADTKGKLARLIEMKQKNGTVG
jgi:hypothetical protein